MFHQFDFLGHPVFQIPWTWFGSSEPRGLSGPTVLGLLFLGMHLSSFQLFFSLTTPYPSGFRLDFTFSKKLALDQPSHVGFPLKPRLPSPWCQATMPACHHATVSLCHRVAMLPCHYATMPPCHQAPMSPGYHVTMSPVYHATCPDSRCVPVYFTVSLTCGLHRDMGLFSFVQNCTY